MSTLKEQMQARLDARPDKETLAYLDSRFDQVVDGYRGLTHAANLVLAEVEDRAATINDLKSQIDAQAAEIHDLRVSLGELQSEDTETFGKMREAFSALQKRVDALESK